MKLGTHHVTSTLQQRRELSTMTNRDRLMERLNALIESDGEVLKIKRGDNKGPMLGKVFVWQETKKHAEKQLEIAWEEVTKAGLVAADDELRKTAGETILADAESNSFSVVVKVDKPRKTFAKDEFIAFVAKKYRIDAAKLHEHAETFTVDGKAPLTKRVLEV